MKEISNTKLLVSLHQASFGSANMQIFDTSTKGKARRIYSFEETRGPSTLVNIDDEITIIFLFFFRCIGIRRYCIQLSQKSPRSNLFEEQSYHLFKIENIPSPNKAAVKLCRKSRWHDQFTFDGGNTTISISIQSLFSIQNLGLVFLITFCDFEKSI